ncbi:MAG: hypothetical protein ACPIOQ_02075 [Promethearchaeia archaeon]
MRETVGRSHWEAPVALEDVQKLHETSSQPCAKDLTVDGAFPPFWCASLQERARLRQYRRRRTNLMLWSEQSAGTRAGFPSRAGSPAPHEHYIDKQHVKPEP